MGQQPCFALDSTRIPGQAPVSPHHSVARHDDGKGIPAVRSTHGPNCRRLPHRARLVAVGHRGPERNRSQHPPRSQLKGRADRLEREIKIPARPCEVFAQLLLGGIEMTAGRIVRNRKSTVEEFDPTQTRRRGDKAQAAERGRNDPCDFIHSPVLAGHLARPHLVVSCMVQESCRTAPPKKPPPFPAEKSSPSSSA